MHLANFEGVSLAGGAGMHRGKFDDGLFKGKKVVSLKRKERSMLLRYQALLEDWQFEHLKRVSEGQDRSTTEMLRVFLCLGFLLASSLPRYQKVCKGVIDLQKIIKLANEGSDPKTSEERHYQITCDVMFNARKAVECMKKVYDSYKNTK